MTGPLDLRVLVLLLAGAFTAYVAYHHPAAGSALMVGVGVVTLLFLLLGSDRGGEPPPR